MVSLPTPMVSFTLRRCFRCVPCKKAIVVLCPNRDEGSVFAAGLPHASRDPT